MMMDMPAARRGSHIAAIILAAGRSARMGHFKLLADIGGVPMLRRVVQTVHAARVSRTIVVTGHKAEAVAAKGVAGAIPVCNQEPDLAPVWEQMGQSGSRVIAVADHGQVLGIITADDISEVFQVMSAAMDGPDRRPQPPAPTPSDSQETRNYV